MGIKDIFHNVKSFVGLTAAPIPAEQALGLTGLNTGNANATLREKNTDMFKAVIPEYLYKPPYGYPRKVNLPLLKKLAFNPYIFSVIKTLQDEASNVDWDIRVKEQFHDDGKDYTEKINEIKSFLQSPNKNNESFTYQLRAIIASILELDAGVWVKVFNKKGELDQLFVRDGASFLKNPDIFGYLGNRSDFIPATALDEITRANSTLSQMTESERAEKMKNYGQNVAPLAAYFQYGFTAGSMPIPFGKKELVYISANPRYDSIYGRSPLEVLQDVILSLVYGSRYNTEFYSSNIPDGVISLIGAQQPQVDGFRDMLQQQNQYTDDFGNAAKKRFFKVPISNTDVKFTPFQLSSKDLEVLSQQEWFTKVVWMCFGVTADEMGFTEKSNKAVGEEQTKLAKRKALKPLLMTIQQGINSEIMPEFFDGGLNLDPADNDDMSFRDIPLEFVFVDEDLEEEKQKLDLIEQKLRMGVLTPEMAASELGIDPEELRKAREEMQQQEQEQNGKENDTPNNNDNVENTKPSKQPEEKSEEGLAPESPKIEKDFEEELDDLESTFKKKLDEVLE